MHICFILRLIHNGRHRSKHTTPISFLLPKLINNSWVTIGGNGRSSDTLKSSQQSRPSLRNSKKKWEPKIIQHRKKKPLQVKAYSPSSPLTLQCLFRLFFHSGNNLFYPLFPCTSLWVPSTPSLRALIKKQMPNGSWQAAPIMGYSPGLNSPWASGNTDSRAAAWPARRRLLTAVCTVLLTIKHLGPRDVTASRMKKAFW